MTWEAYLGILGILASIAFGYLAFSRNKRADYSTEGRQLGQIMSDLGYVKSNTDEIKAEQQRQRDTNMAFAERLAKAEARLEEHISASNKRSSARIEKGGV